MPDFNANADVYVARVRQRITGMPLPIQPRPDHSGNVAECITWMIENNDGYPGSYTVEVPLEAGFGKSVLTFQEIEELSRHPNFPK
jgi:hypothetical protein